MWGKEGKMAHELLMVYDIKELEVLFDDFFKMDSEFVKKTGYSLGVFRTQVPKLLVEQKSRQDKQEHKLRIQRETARKTPLDDASPASPETIASAIQAMKNFKLKGI